MYMEYNLSEDDFVFISKNFKSCFDEEVEKALVEEKEIGFNQIFCGSFEAGSRGRCQKSKAAPQRERKKRE